MRARGVLAMLRTITAVTMYLGLGVGSTNASVIEFTHHGFGSGTLNGVFFPTTSITFVAFGDTSSRLSFVGGYQVPHTSASVTIDGVGQFTIQVPTLTFVNNTVQTVGFSHDQAGMSNDLDLFNGPAAPAFAAWDMTTPLGPVAGDGNMLQWTMTPLVQTSGGVLIIANGSTTAEFTAHIVPSPAPALAACLAAAAGRRRRNFQLACAWGYAAFG